MAISASRLKKLQITLTRPVEMEALEFIDNQPDSEYAGIITFPKGTVFSRLRKENGWISGISSEIGDKRYFVYSIPRATEWTLERNDQYLGYFHGGSKKTRKNNKNKNNNKSRRK
jgi:hypothetical protein